MSYRCNKRLLCYLAQRSAHHYTMTRTNCVRIWTKSQCHLSTISRLYRLQGLIGTGYIQRFIHTTSDVNSADHETAVNLDVSHEELVELLKQGRVNLIDVREANEVGSSGIIPTATNIPLRLLTQVLSLKEEKFEHIFGVPKPQEEDEIIFTCLIGKRSFVARQMAISMGYSRARNYPGGWSEWKRKMEDEEKT